MARVLFAKGARGEIVKKLQARLLASGFDPRGIDGDYGKNTERAVTAFRRANALAALGEVDVATWRRLMRRRIPSVRDRCLQLTAAFEEHGFTVVQGNYDGAGLTWGIIGFTLRYGGISKLVLQAHARDPELVRRAFGRKTDELLRMMRARRAEQLAWADRISIGASKERVREPWRSAFRRFGELEEVQALQTHLADASYFQPAVRSARELGLTTELGLALAFDIHVQNGGISSSARTAIRNELAEHPLSRERELRTIIGNAVADASRPRFREDVRARKLTIAAGSGKVHGASYVLRNWGLDDVRVRA
jgi:hypothetical protein